MEKIAEMLFQAYQKYADKEYPEDFIAAQRKFFKCLSEQQRFEYSEFERFEIQRGENQMIEVILFVLKLINPDEE